MDYSQLDFSDRAMLNRVLHKLSGLDQLNLLQYALSERADDIFLHSHIGRVLYSLDQLPEATCHLDVAIKANSNDPSVYFYRALLHLKRKEMSQCAALLEHAVSLTDNADYRLNLISVLMHLHRFDDAITHSTEGLKTLPTEARFARAKTEALIANKQFDLALRWCNEQDTARTNPDWPLLRYQIHTGLNNNSKAAAEYQEGNRRKIVSQADYRNKAKQVLASITDLTLRNQLAELWESSLKKFPSNSVTNQSQQQLPRVAMTILVRDEADIIAENIRYHAAHGVSHFIVTDNGSIDGTREILAQLRSEYSLDIIDEPSHTIDQDLWVTRMAQQLQRKANCDWVIHNDADEFWVPASGSLPEAINTALEAQSHIGVFSCKRINMLPEKQQVALSEYAFHDNCFAALKSVPLLQGEQPWSGEGSNCVARTVMDKVLTKLDGLGDVEYGNHGAEHAMANGDCNSVTILHYPVRTYQQFERKVVNYGESLAQNNRFSPNSSMHLRYWYQRYLEDKLGDDYDSITFDQNRLQALLKQGYVVKDTRVQTYFQVEDIHPKVNQPGFNFT